MQTINLSQTAPISQLPRDYLKFLRQSEKNNEPIIFLRHNKPVGALLSDKVYNDLMAIKQAYEERKVLKLAEEGRNEYRVGKARKLKSIASLMEK